MSNSFYHKDLTEAQWDRIKFLFEVSTLLEMDSIFCKVHKSACSGKEDQAIGSSRGGKNTKVHVLINDRMQLLKEILTGGQIHDSEPAIALLKGIKLKGKKILADKA